MRHKLLYFALVVARHSGTSAVTFSVLCPVWLLTFAMLSRKLQIHAEGSGHEERHAMNGDTLVLETLGWFFYPCPEKGGRPVCKGVFDNHGSTNPWLIELGESVFRCSFSRWVPNCL